VEADQDVERRQFFRVITRIFPRYAARVDEQLVELKAFDAVILDLSGGGLLLQSRQWVPVFSRLRLMFSLADDPLEFDIQVTPRALGQGALMQQYSIHCAFTDMRRSDVDRIVRYVYRQQLMLRRRGLL